MTKAVKSILERQERLRQQYRDEGWGKLAEQNGQDPLDVESQARDAFRFCYDLMQKQHNLEELLSKTPKDEILDIIESAVNDTHDLDVRDSDYARNVYDALAAAGYLPLEPRGENPDLLRAVRNTISQHMKLGQNFDLCAEDVLQMVRTNSQPVMRTAEGDYIEGHVRPDVQDALDVVTFKKGWFFTP